MAHRSEPLGPSPYSEECAQVGTDNYPELSRLECKALIVQLKEKFGEPPEGSKLVVKSEDHDFGSYREVYYEFEQENDAHCEYFVRLEDEFPARWNETARRLLEAHGGQRT